MEQGWSRWKGKRSFMDEREHEKNASVITGNGERDRGELRVKDLVGILRVCVVTL